MTKTERKAIDCTVDLITYIKALGGQLREAENEATEWEANCREAEQRCAELEAMLKGTSVTGPRTLPGYLIPEDQHVEDLIPWQER